MSVFIHLKLALQCFSTKLILFWKSKRSIIYPFFWNKWLPSCCFTTWQHKQGKLFFKTGHSSLKQCVWGCKTKWFERQRASACDVSHRLCLNRKHRLSPKWGLRQRETERGPLYIIWTLLQVQWEQMMDTAFTHSHTGFTQTYIKVIKCI